MKINWGLIILTIAFGACSNKQNPEPSDGKATLSISGNAGDITITKASIDLPASTDVGVYVLQTGMSPATMANTPFKNVLYTATGTGGAFTSNSPIVLENVKTYNVCAYTPRLQSTPPDASSVSFQHGTDVLYTSSTAITITGTVASATLSFEHKMAQIKFVLASGVGSPNITGATLNVTGFNESGAINLTDGSISAVMGKGAIITDVDKAICFVPNVASMTLAITVNTTDNRAFTGSISRVFNAANSYTYTITLNKNNTQLNVTGEVVNWIPVDGGSISVNG
jgi:hypothetical protein